MVLLAQLSCSVILKYMHTLCPAIVYVILVTTLLGDWSQWKLSAADSDILYGHFHTYVLNVHTVL